MNFTLCRNCDEQILWSIDFRRYVHWYKEKYCRALFDSNNNPTTEAEPVC